MSLDRNALLAQLRRFATLVALSSTGGEALLSDALKTQRQLGVVPDDDERLLVDLLSTIVSSHRRAKIRLEQPSELMPGSGPLAALSQMPEAARLVFLLGNVEKLTADQVAAVMQMSMKECAEARSLAEQSLLRVIAAKVLLIEPQDAPGSSLAPLLASLGHQVVGPAHSREAALALLGTSALRLCIDCVSPASLADSPDRLQADLDALDIPLLNVLPSPSQAIGNGTPRSPNVISAYDGPGEIAARITHLLLKSYKQPAH